MTTVSLSTIQATQLVDLLTVAAAGADDEDRFQLDYSRAQVGELMAPSRFWCWPGCCAR